MSTSTEQRPQLIYRFTFTLDGPTACSDDMADAIFEAGGDDSGVSSRDGVVSVDFDRAAESLDAALSSAAKVIADAGYRVASIEIDDDTLRSITA